MSSRARLHFNVAANYAGQLYSAGIGIAMVPIYLRLLGSEAYGLIGFFTLLQSWASLLDVGLSASVSRQSSRYAGGALDALDFRRLLRVFEWLFWLVGLLLALGLVLGAGRIASSWLHVRQLPMAEVERAIEFMALTVATRWVCSLYRGVLAGVERQVWLNGFNAAIVTLRFVVAVPVAIAFQQPVSAFFAFQVLVGFLELGGLVWATYRAAPVTGAVPLAGSHPVLRETLHFSAWVGIATLVWVSVSESDKLVISTVLPLADYGYFTAAVNAASPVSLLGFAVSQAVLPRMIQLALMADRQPLFALYRRTTQLTVAAGAAVALTLAVLGRPLLWAWTGDARFAAEFAPVLALYVVGNFATLLATFPYGLQHAIGDLRLHVRGQVLLAATMVPSVLFYARAYGALGAAWVWAVFMAGYLLLWTPLVHRRFAPGLQARWLLRDIGAVAALPCGLAALAGAIVPGATSRVGVALQAVALFIVLLVAALSGVSEVQQRVRARLHGWRANDARDRSQTR